MEISEHELRVMTRDLVEMEHDLRPRFLASVAELADQVREEMAAIRRAAHIAATRRTFLRGGLVTAGAVGGAALVSACGGGGGGGAASSSSSTPSVPAVDLTVSRLAASLEVLAVSTYGAALKAAQGGAFGAVPAAFGTFAQTAQSQHQQHQDAWNAILGSAGQPKQTQPNPKYNGIVQQQLGQLKTLKDVANLALTLETVAMETYVAGTGLVQTQKGRQTSLSIAPVEAQHVAILQAVLGIAPDPNSAFVKTDMAAGPDSLNG